MDDSGLQLTGKNFQNSKLLTAEGGNEWIFLEGDGSFVTSNEVTSNCCPLAELPRLRSVTPGSGYMKIRCREEAQERFQNDDGAREPIRFKLN